MYGLWGYLLKAKVLALINAGRVLKGGWYLKMLFVQPGNLLVPAGQKGLFSSPVHMPASVFISKKMDRQWSGFEYLTPHWIAKWIISVFNRVSVWKPQGYTVTQTAHECSGWGGGGRGMYNVRVVDWERKSCFGFKELEIQILPYHFHIVFSPPFL